jgi:hypothetical protein
MRYSYTGDYVKRNFWKMFNELAFTKTQDQKNDELAKEILSLFFLQSLNEYNTNSVLGSKY